MKTRLTLTIDEVVVARAKRYARRRGISLSALIEEALRHLSQEEPPSFVERWRGRFEPASRDDARLRFR